MGLLPQIASRLLGRFAGWALKQNAPGGYAGEDDARWAYTIETDGKPYLTRVMAPRIFGVRVFLHHFHRPDGDRHLHSHPWHWGASLILTGSYVEERLDEVAISPDGAWHELRSSKIARFWNFLTKNDYHAVKELRDDVWTLFVTGPRTDSGNWGFLVDGRPVHWRTFLHADKKETP